MDEWGDEGLDVSESFDGVENVSMDTMDYSEPMDVGETLDNVENFDEVSFDDVSESNYVDSIMDSAPVEELTFDDEIPELEAPVEGSEEIPEVEAPMEFAEEISELEAPMEVAEEISEVEMPVEFAEEVPEVEAPMEVAEEIPEVEMPVEIAEEVPELEAPMEVAEEIPEVEMPAEFAEEVPEVENLMEFAEEIPEELSEIEEPVENAEEIPEEVPEVEAPVEVAEEIPEVDEMPLMEEAKEDMEDNSISGLMDGVPLENMEFEGEEEINPQAEFVSEMTEVERNPEMVLPSDELERMASETGEDGVENLLETPIEPEIVEAERPENQFGSFETGKYINNEAVVKGDHFDQYMEEYYDSENSKYESLGENAFVETISPSAIEGIHLGPGEAADENVFWSQHEKGGTMDSFKEIASHIPEVRRQLDSGKTLAEIRDNEELGKCASIYFDPENMPRVVKNDGYYEFDSNGRHRILAARELGYDIPVRVIGKRIRST